MIVKGADNSAPGTDINSYNPAKSTRKSLSDCSYVAKGTFTLAQGRYDNHTQELVSHRGFMVCSRTSHSSRIYGNFMLL